MKLHAPALALALAAGGAANAHAQQKPADKPAAQSPATGTTAAAAPATTSAAAKPAITPASTPAELARAAYTALGGDRYRELKNMILTGSVDLYAPNSTQTLSGKFGMITAGERMRQEVQSPLFSFSLVSDGQVTRSTMRMFEMPPAGKFGLPVLLKHDQAGYEVSALPDRKKERAFRVTEPGGMVTDYYVDASTAQLRRFEVPYGPYTYSVEFKAVKQIDGLFVPASFVQRMATPQGDFFAEFKVKDAKLNQDLPEDTFKLPGQ